jgi:hypothetical protein
MVCRPPVELGRNARKLARPSYEPEACARAHRHVECEWLFGSGPSSVPQLLVCGRALEASEQRGVGRRR